MFPWPFMFCLVIPDAVLGGWVRPAVVWDSFSLRGLPVNHGTGAMAIAATWTTLVVSLLWCAKAFIKPAALGLSFWS